LNQVLIDTDTLSFFFRGNENVVNKLQEYLTYYDKINISIISYYEILSGLRFRDSKKILKSFIDFTEQCSILPLTKESTEISSDIYANLRKQGNPINDMDLLIAGIAVSNEMILVTHNSKHFNRIENLDIEDWIK